MSNIFQSQYGQPNCKKRMNSSQDKEKIYLLEDCEDFCKSKIKEAEIIPNSKNIFQSWITVECFDYMNGAEEKKYFIQDLKNLFYLVKIINTNTMEENEINFLVSKENQFLPNEETEILNKINNKACFGNKIKKILNIDEFPLENYYLEKEKAKINVYDKIYSLKKILKNNSFNIFPNNDQYVNYDDRERSLVYSENNNILNNNELINRMNQLEEKMNSMDKKLDTILGKMQK